MSSSKATVKIDTALLVHGRGRAQGGGDSLPRRGARRDRHQAALRRPRHAAEGEGRAAGEARRQLHRRAEPAVGVAAVADRDRRAADVPRSRPPRRRALPAAGRHEGGARQGRRPLHDRHPLAAAREEGPVRRRRPRRARTSSPAFATKRSATRRASRSRRRSRIWCCARPTRRPASSRLVGALKPEAQKRIQDGAVQQNITILRNRVNELGVAEPIVQQQGADRVVVQLPGVQDTARAKDILGRTATLEIRMVNDEPGALEAALAGQPPFGSDLYTERSGGPLLVRRQVVLTGDRINDAQPGFDQRNNEPAVHVNLDGTGARIFKEVTRENVGKRMAIVLVEKGKARGHHGAGDPRGDRRRARADQRPDEHARGERHRAPDARRRAGGADGDRRGAHGRTVARQGEHRQGLQLGLLRLHRAGAVHVRVLPADGPHLDDRAVGQPAASRRAAVDTIFRTLSGSS